jgi:hypothetical protein
LKLVVHGQTDRPTDQPTDQPTDRRTLSHIELLSQLKTTNLVATSFATQPVFNDARAAHALHPDQNTGDTFSALGKLTNQQGWAKADKNMCVGRVGRFLYN